MNHNNSINTAVEYFKKISPEKFGDEGMVQLPEEAESRSTAITVLSVAGGILACIAFFGFLFIGNLFDTPDVLLFIGIISVVLSIIVSRRYNRILIDTIGISSFLAGLIMIGVAMDYLSTGDTLICIALIAVSIVSLFSVRRYAWIFLSILVIHGSLFSLILIYDATTILALYVSALIILVTLLFLYEAKIIMRLKAFPVFYEAGKTAIALGVISGMAYFTGNGVLPHSVVDTWLLSVVVVGLLIYTSFALINRLLQPGFKLRRALILLAAFSVVLTLLSPSITGMILLMLLTFYAGNKVLFFMATVALFGFLWWSYYELNFSLLAKSILLMVSGLLFILAYYFTLTTERNEKI